MREETQLAVSSGFSPVRVYSLEQCGNVCVLIAFYSQGTIKLHLRQRKITPTTQRDDGRKDKDRKKIEKEEEKEE